MQTLQTEYDQSPSVLSISSKLGKHETIVHLLNTDVNFWVGGDLLLIRAI